MAMISSRRNTYCETVDKVSLYHEERANGGGILSKYNNTDIDINTVGIF